MAQASLPALIWLLAALKAIKKPPPAAPDQTNPGQLRTTNNSYDVNGFLTGITDDTGANTAPRQFVGDANGIVLQKTQQANVFKQLVVMGQVMARQPLIKAFVPPDKRAGHAR